MLGQKPESIRWSKGGQIQFIDGSAWGVAPNSVACYLGTEAEVLLALENKTRTKSHVVNQILHQELECQNALAQVPPETLGRKSRARKVNKYNRSLKSK